MSAKDWASTPPQEGDYLPIQKQLDLVVWFHSLLEKKKSNELPPVVMPSCEKLSERMNAIPTIFGLPPQPYIQNQSPATARQSDCHTARQSDPC